MKLRNVKEVSCRICKAEIGEKCVSKDQRYFTWHMCRIVDLYVTPEQQQEIDKDKVTGPISSLPGTSHDFPENAICDTHPSRKAVARIQGEIDSFGSEMYDMC